MGQAISTLQTADSTITSMRSIVGAMKGVVDEAAASSDSSERANSGKQFNELLVQLNQLASDGSYKGVNLLQSAQSDSTAGGAEEVKVQFNESFDDSTLTVSGINIAGAQGSGTAGVELNDSNEIANASAVTGARTIGTASTASSQSYAITLNVDSTITGGATAAANQAVVGIRAADITGTSAAAENATGTGHTLSFVDDDNYQANLTQMVSDLEAFDNALVSNAKSLSSSLNIVTIRQDFTNSLINTLEEGADKLTLADLNEEGANLLALQTSQQLGIQSLSLASSSNQAVLGLLG
jgi:flagellin-like hook-associated protein FlgL